MGKFTLAPLAIVLLLVMVACGEAAAPAAPAASEPVVVEVTREVEVEKVVEKPQLVEVIKEVQKVTVATPTAVPPPGTVSGPVGSVFSATSDMAEMGMDPTLENSSNVKAFTDELHLYGIMQSSQGELIGGAAVKWEVSPDQHSWVFTVRDGVKFHNGDTMTAEDFSWSWNRHVLSDEAETSTAATWGPHIEYIRPEGDTVVVRTKEPEPLMPLWWPSYEGTQAGMVLSKAEFDRTGAEGVRNNPIGAGTFKFVERSRGEFVKLEAFEDHYCCVPGFKELTVLEIPEISTRLALLKTGGADLIEAVPAIKPDLVSSGFLTFSGHGATSSSMWFPYMNIPQSPFHDKRVREAINIAINREAIVERLYAGEGGPTPSFFSGPGSFGFNADLPGYPYDPVRAQQLMQDAGYGDGFEVRIITYLYDADFPDMPTLSQAVLGDLQALGISGQIEVKEWGAVKAEMVSLLKAACGGETVWCPGEEANPEVAGEEPYPLFLRGNDTRFHALRQNRGYMHPEGRRPVIQLPWLAEEMDLVASEFDFAKQRELFEEYNRKVHEEYVQGLLIYANAVFAVSDKVGDWQPITGRTYPNNQWTLRPAE
jgi:ABC-type transport system substrate-binding protein